MAPTGAASLPMAWTLFLSKEGPRPMPQGLRRVPRGTGLVDQDQRLGLGWELTAEVVEGAWPGADRPRRAEVSLARFRGIGHCDGIFMNIQPDRSCARVRRGCPPRSCVIGHGARHEAARAYGQLTRGVHRRSASPPGSHDV
jgi:hypothetical protein